ncbi:hypothetical protein WJX72_000510 [[Myrmecia] bisecta]|uniref:Uncharacterized protein n=1 Tax=[Myrmecia] bisecta TaxID=41462 RepID=A0AAW1Q3Z8_9CHLO
MGGDMELKPWAVVTELADTLKPLTAQAGASAAIRKCVVDIPRVANVLVDVSQESLLNTIPAWRLLGGPGAYDLLREVFLPALARLPPNSPSCKCPPYWSQCRCTREDRQYCRRQAATLGARQLLQGTAAALATEAGTATGRSPPPAT